MDKTSIYLKIHLLLPLCQNINEVITILWDTVIELSQLFLSLT